MTTRQDLLDLVDAYLDALSANDPSRLPVTPNVKYTENCQALPLGKGMWATATPHVTESHFVDVVDEANGQIVYFGVVEEAGRSSVMALRLKADGARISEIEVLVCREPGESGQPRVFKPENMTEPKPIFFETVPPEERCDRDELVRIANLYFDGILAGDGDMIPVVDDCIRVENGMQTVFNPERGTETGKLGVAAQVSSGVFRDIEAARDRRFLITDEERGLVFVNFFFDHPGPVTNAGFTSRYTQPNSMQVAELFKIKNLQIIQIEAVLNVFPYGTKSGWD